MSSDSDSGNDGPYVPSQDVLDKIADLQEKRKKISDGLALCDTNADQSPAPQMQQIIDRIDKTISVLKTIPIQLKHYLVRFAIPQSTTNRPLDVRIRIDQMPDSLPLDLNYFIVIKPPFGDTYSTPRVASKMTQVNYVHTFQIPDRSQRSISIAKSNEIVFQIYKYTTQFHIAVGKGKTYFVASAKAPLLPLCFSSHATTALEFVDQDGDPMDYKFEVSMLADEPLIPNNNLVIEEQIDLLKE
ncbi:hypothetical protein TRFO_17088 [Tritrichomonas foetus]|uniref:Uncharacterized protein n=1 Tax=Tritrichomonas foetus TaxID=1144522 RepID=A0A1J4KPV4_9EUKA|nr:hypothetical protein TRFO_17088 [Tritrichomonas foetus]|eukprot:OHT12928.1 hypothetical protein TRFO_17088 [Tritrichomonas foetus]